MSPDPESSDPRARFLAELEWEIKWQWRWEKKYRRLAYAMTWATWLSSFLILVLAFYQLQLGTDLQKWVILAITALSTLSVSLPVLSMSFKFQQRQEVYDRMGRAYSLLKMKVEMGAIGLEDALAEFERIHSQPTEKVIRETA